jgi:hypothetical protein
MMTVLKLEGEDDDWRLHLDGEWSLTAIAQIEALLRDLPGGLRGTLTCDWSRAEKPAMGAAWTLLMRLGEIGAANLEIRHTGNPPHFLELLQKLELQPRAPHAAAAARTVGVVGRLGRWSVLQGRHAQAVLEIGRAHV